jgi:hypothetical protein
LYEELRRQQKAVYSAFRSKFCASLELKGADAVRRRVGARVARRTQSYCHRVAPCSMRLGEWLCRGANTGHEVRQITVIERKHYVFVE